MAEYHGLPLIPPRIAPFWTDVMARLDSANMRVVLGGVGRILRASDARPDLPDGTWWGRVVLTPVETPWQQDDQPGREVNVRWLVVAEAHKPEGLKYDPTITLEAAQIEAFLLLHGWVPGVKARYQGRHPMIRVTPPQPMPFYEETEDLYYTSAEYQCLLSPVEEDYGG